MKILFFLFLTIVCEAQPFTILQAKTNRVCYSTLYEQDTCYSVIGLFSVTNERVCIIEDGRMLIIPLMLYEHKANSIRVLARDEKLWTVINIKDGKIDINVESLLFENINIAYDIERKTNEEGRKHFLITIFSTKTVNNNEH